MINGPHSGGGDSGVPDSTTSNHSPVGLMFPGQHHTIGNRSAKCVRASGRRSDAAASARSETRGPERSEILQAPCDAGGRRNHRSSGAKENHAGRLMATRTSSRVGSARIGGSRTGRGLVYVQRGSARAGCPGIDGVHHVVETDRCRVAGTSRSAAEGAEGQLQLPTPSHELVREDGWNALRLQPRTWERVLGIDPNPGSSGWDCSPTPENAKENRPVCDSLAQTCLIVGVGAERVGANRTGTVLRGFSARDVKNNGNRRCGAV